MVFDPDDMEDTMTCSTSSLSSPVRSRRTTLCRLGAGALAVGLAVGLAGPVQAKDGDVTRTGSCSKSADWKLKAGPRDGRIEVEGEVDSNVAGQNWTWRILHNGTVSAKGLAKTTAPSGSFSVERKVVNLAGKDIIGWRATNRGSGETCRGSLTL